MSTQTEKEQAGLRDCVNSGAVTGKRDNVGAVCSSATLGIVRAEIPAVVGAELTFTEGGAFPAPPAGARRALGLENGSDE